MMNETERERLIETALDLRMLCDDDLVDGMERAVSDLCDEFGTDNWDDVFDALNKAYIYGNC